MDISVLSIFCKWILELQYYAAYSELVLNYFSMINFLENLVKRTKRKLGMDVVAKSDDFIR